MIKYQFAYYFKKDEEEKEITITAENDEQAIKIFYDKIGIAEFGCIREDGQSFTDEDYPEIKKIMKRGC